MPYRLSEVIVLPAAMDTCGHHIARRRAAGIEAVYLEDDEFVEVPLPGAQISIAGHTDVRGDDAYNQTLSERRAGSVRSWLTAHGVEGSHITATGAGESRPLRAGNTEEDHQANRRVEIRIRN